MADGKARVVGGPFDGVSHPPAKTAAGRMAKDIGVRRGPRQAWINEAGTVSAGPGRGRELYVLEDGLEAGEKVYVFAGHTHARCDCGTYMRKPEGGRDAAPCPVCGGTPARRKA